MRASRCFGFRSIVCYEFPEVKTPKRNLNKSPCFFCFLTFIEGLVNIAEMGENEGEVWELEGKIAKGSRTKAKKN